MGAKIQTAIKIDKELLEVLKEKAKANQSSLDNYIELLLYQNLSDIPNETTIAAIEDARSNRNLEEIENVDDFLDSL